MIVGAVTTLEYDGSTRTLEADIQVPPRSYPTVVEEEVLSPIVFAASCYLDAGTSGASAVLAFQAPKFLAGAFLPPVSLLPIKPQVKKSLQSSLGNFGYGICRHDRAGNEYERSAKLHHCGGLACAAGRVIKRMSRRCIQVARSGGSCSLDVPHRSATLLCGLSAQNGHCFASRIFRL